MNRIKELNEKIEKYQMDIDERNRDSFIVFADGALFLSIIIVFASILVQSYRPFLFMHCGIALYACFLYFWSRKCKEKNTKEIRTHMYLSFVPLLMGAILLGTYFDPSRQAVTIVVFLCILPLFIIDKPWHLALFQLVFTLIFAFMSYSLKPQAVFYADTVYLPIYLLLGISANVFTAVERVNGVQNYAMLRIDSERDALTDVLNRKSGEEKTKLLLNAHTKGTFAILDIDDFKNFNDEYGHQTGDEVLRLVSSSLISVFRTSDVIWRLGGDEFAIFMVHMSDEEVIQKRLQTFLDRLSSAKLSVSVKDPISVSIGCVVCDQDAIDFDQAYESSDKALYEAKKMGRGKIQFWKERSMG